MRRRKRAPTTCSGPSARRWPPTANNSSPSCRTTSPSTFDTVQHPKGSRFTFEQLGRVFQESNPNGYLPFNGEATAWDLARATPVLEDVDYRIRAMLERTYKEQTFLSGYGDRILSDLHFGAVPPNADYFPVAISFTLDASDVIASEGRLLRLYDRTLLALDAALR